MTEKEVDPNENTIFVGNKPPMSYVTPMRTPSLLETNHR